ncbi:Oxa1Ec [Oligella ureolytica]|uniref:Membrane protein insertase YidC n=1 Tax=Oligella ureolytica TaxID=90244 RepID=A0A378XEU0_9BURK|nr:membrane protein insertase YidC [Oligella ureolytica]QPT39000.1 membrane protein insertase YidC [Oligella ureolytica]SUA54418.1 Oxa1Ec [Oligella ureolytica]
MDTRRSILWMIFAFSLFMIWNSWMTYNNPPVAELTEQQQQEAQAREADLATPSSIPSSATNANSPQVAMSDNASSATVEQEIVTIKTDVFTMQFDTKGAQIVGAKLHLSHEEESDNVVDFVLLDNGQHVYTVQSGLVGSAGSNYPNQNTLFSLVSEQTEMTGDTLDVVFEAESDGLKLTRTYTFNRGTFKIDVEDTVTNISSVAQSPSLYLQITRDNLETGGGTYFDNAYNGFAMYTDQHRFQKISFSDIEKKKGPEAGQSDDGWISFIQQFFVTAWVPEEGKNRFYDTRQISNNLYAISAIEPLGAIEPDATISTKSVLWVGPQDQQQLSEISTGLDLVVNYGWLTIIAKPMFKLMTWLHSFIGNWGWTIVVLTIIIKIVLYPLSAASYRSMARMKHVGPRMQALKEKFGDDRQKLNQAMMELYRTEKINPMGGCLPILLQIPIFLTLYRVILASVELRGAPWILWIQDLSLADPYFILPAIMTATMFLQFKLNPTPPDPMQARIMMIMPLVFGAMMFMFPAGLVLYWVVNNILSIAQQQFITRRLARAANDS